MSYFHFDNLSLIAVVKMAYCQVQNLPYLYEAVIQAENEDGSSQKSI